MMPRCEEIDEVLAAYALDAVDADERLAVLEHLAECRLHDEALLMYREAAGMLPLALEDVRPTPAARSSLLSAFEAAKADEARDPAALPIAQPQPSSAPARPTAQTPARTPVVVAPQRSGLPFFRTPNLGFGLAAALLVAVLGLAAWNLSLQADDRDLVARTTTSQGDMSLELYYLEDDGVAVLKLEMPPLTGGRVYQAWQLVSGQPVSLGVVHGTGVTAVPAELAGASAIAISVEPPGGSAAPTTTPVLIAEL
jgi:anti-sigma-K factor RskA